MPSRQQQPLPWKQRGSVVVVWAIMVFPWLSGALAGVAEEGGLVRPSYPPPVSFHRSVTAGLIRGYQVILSPSKGSHCPMTPHCSRYGMQAFGSHDPLSAFVMVSDRLHRCGHDLRYYDLTVVDGQMRFRDPVPGLASVTDQGEPGPRLAVAAAFGSTSRGEQENPAESSREQLLAFARSLEAYGDYQRAVTEYLRFISYHPAAPEGPEAFLGLMRAHYYQRAFEDVIRLGRQVPEECLPDQAAEAAFYVGLSLMKVENYRGAFATFADLGETGVAPYAAKAALLAGRCLAHQRLWSEARVAFDQVPRSNPYHRFAENNVAICAGELHPDRKSPTTAGVLSVVPGLGYLYAGYPKTALSAFLVTSGFIWATVESFERDDTGLGVLLGVLSFGWYTGNIYGSIGSAKRYNAWKHDMTLASLEFGFVF